MVIETCQILSTVMREQYGENIGYHSTHKSHPCVKWASQSYDNWCWLYLFGLYLSAEYTYRYGKVHKCQEVLDNMMNVYLMAGRLAQMAKNLPPQDPDWIRIDTPALAMPDDCKLDDPVNSYRNYYLKYKSHLLTYTRRKVPDWIQVARLGKWKESK
jgi:hypothetical protein